MTLGQYSMMLVIGWQTYGLARTSGMSIEGASGQLALIGLLQFAPLFLLTPFSGLAADRFDRRKLAQATILLQFLCATALCTLTWMGDISIPWLFGIAIVLGVVRAFNGPALSSLSPNLVPKAILPTAIALSSISWQVGMIAGPAIGGYLHALMPALPYGVAAGLFAVFLAGATALFPVYARDILQVGEEGLAQLAMAPAIGAVLTGMFFSYRPLSKNVGPAMLGAVAVFGVATIIFGLSTSMPLSLAALFVVGAADMFSVYIRQSLIQLHTPDEKRGRVSSVSHLTISASNEGGDFFSGSLAYLIGPVPAVVAGGVGAIVTVTLWSRIFSVLRTTKTFDPPADLSDKTPNTDSQEQAQ